MAELTLAELRKLHYGNSKPPAPSVSQGTGKSSGKELTLADLRKMKAQSEAQKAREAREAEAAAAAAREEAPRGWGAYSPPSMRDLAPNAIQNVSDVMASVSMGPGGSTRDQERDLTGTDKGRRIGPAEGIASATGAGLVGAGEAVGSIVEPWIPEAVKKGGAWAIKKFMETPYGQSAKWAWEQGVDPVLNAAEEAAPDTYNTLKNVGGGLATIGPRGVTPGIKMGEKAQGRIDLNTKENTRQHLERHVPRDPDKINVGEEVSTGSMPWSKRDSWELDGQTQRAMDEVNALPDVKPNSTAHDVARAVTKAEKKAMDDLDKVLDKHKDSISDPEVVMHAAEDALDTWQGSKTMGMRSKHSKTIDLLKDDLRALIFDKNNPLTPRRLREIRQKVDELINEKDFGTEGSNAQSAMGLVLRKTLNEQLDLSIPDGSARELLTKWSNLETARPLTIKASNIEGDTWQARLADKVGLSRAKSAAGAAAETEIYTNPGAGSLAIAIKSIGVAISELGLRGMPLAKAKARVGKAIADIDKKLKLDPNANTLKVSRATLVDFLANGTQEDLDEE